MSLEVKKQKNKERLLYLHGKMQQECTREVFIRGCSK